MTVWTDYDRLDGGQRSWHIYVSAERDFGLQGRVRPLEGPEAYLRESPVTVLPPRCRLRAPVSKDTGLDLREAEINTCADRVYTLVCITVHVSTSAT